MKLLRQRIDTLNEHQLRLQALGDDDVPDHDEEDLPIQAPFKGHVKLGSPMRHSSSICDIESRGQSDRAFQGFRRKFTEFINTSLPTYGYELTSWLTFPADFQVS